MYTSRANYKIHRVLIIASDLKHIEMLREVGAGLTIVKFSRDNTYVSRIFSRISPNLKSSMNNCRSLMIGTDKVAKIFRLQDFKKIAEIGKSFAMYFLFNRCLHCFYLRRFRNKISVHNRAVIWYTSYWCRG